MTIKAEHPQSIGGVLDATFRLYRGTFLAVWPLALLSMAVWIPAALLSTYGLSNAQDLEAVAAALTSWRFWGSMLVAGVISIWCYAAAMWRMHALVEESPISFGESLLRGLARLPGIVLATVVYLLVILVMGFLASIVGGVVFGVLFAAGGTTTSLLLLQGVLMVVLFIPMLVFYVSYYFYLSAMVVDGRGPFGSLGRSRSLVKGNWFRAAALLTVGMILWAVLYIAASAAGELVRMPFDDLLFGMVTSQVIVLLLSSLIMPFLPALSLSIYYDLKLRREGGDLLERVQAVGAT